MRSEGEAGGGNGGEAESGTESDVAEADCEPGEDCGEAGESEEPVEDLGFSVWGEDCCVGY